MRRVAVTGLGVISPVGNDVPTFWNNLVNGVSGIREISYFDVSESKWKFAGEVKDFNPAERLDKTTVRKNDMFTLFALAAADEAMADSGIAGTVDEAAFGVYFGSGIGGIDTLCGEYSNLVNAGPRKVSPLFIPKMIDNIAAGSIAIRHKAHGPCVAVSTACATGTTAMGEAFRAIRHGYADAAICGGSEAAITPLTVAGFGNCQALSAAESADTASLPFDARRGGFVIGEGAGVLVLEEYEHAVARGAHIYAEVVGYGSTCDAHHVTAPDPEAVYTSKAVKDAMIGLDVPAENIYINAHGTGTKLNDKTETAAFKKAFGEDAYKLHISSTKSMTGHMLGAAGAAEAIVAVKALETGIVPPTINLTEQDPECDLNYTPGTAVKADIRLAMSTSLGFGGHNACIAVSKADD